MAEAEKIMSVSIAQTDVACMVAAASRLIEGTKEAFAMTSDNYIDKDKALEWMLTNYEIVAGAVYSVAELLELPTQWLIDT